MKIFFLNPCHSLIFYLYSTLMDCLTNHDKHPNSRLDVPSVVHHLSEKLQQHLEQIQALYELDPMEAYSYLIEQPCHAEAFPEEKKQEAYRFSQCVSDVYIFVEKINSSLFLHSFSSSLIVNGYLNLLKSILNNHPWSVWQAIAPAINEFTQQLQHFIPLSPNRTEGINHLIDYIMKHGVNQQ